MTTLELKQLFPLSRLIECGNATIEQIEKEKQLRDFISSTTDPQIKLILQLRYIDQLSWRDVAFVIGGRNTSGSVKQIAHRYLAKTERS